MLKNMMLKPARNFERCLQLQNSKKNYEIRLSQFFSYKYHPIRQSVELSPRSLPLWELYCHSGTCSLDDPWCQTHSVQQVLCFLDCNIQVQHSILYMKMAKLTFSAETNNEGNCLNSDSPLMFMLWYQIYKTGNKDWERLNFYWSKKVLCSWLFFKFTIFWLIWQ